MATVGSIEFGSGGSGLEAAFSFDLTGSYLSVAQMAVTAVQQFLEFRESGQYAVVTHSDYPGYVIDRTTGNQISLGVYNYNGVMVRDYAFNVDLGASSYYETSQFLPSIFNRTTVGANASESYTRVIWEMSQSDTQAKLGGSPESLVMFLDEVPHGYQTFGAFQDILDPGRVGDSAQDTLIPYTSPLYFDSAVSDFNGRLIIVNSGFYAQTFWESRIGSQVDAYLYWQSPFSISTLVSFLNANI